ncbi:MAG: alpha/beta hydrolase family protein [Nitrospinota bacterium]
MKLRTQRDSHQWMLDLALNLTGRVQNFEIEEAEHAGHPKNYRQIPKLQAERADRYAATAKAYEVKGYKETAIELYYSAAMDYRLAQHPIFYDDHPRKIELHRKLSECIDRIIALSSYRIERVEIPFDGSQIQCLLYLHPGGEPRPCIVYVPGMDQTKEVFPNPAQNLPLERGLHCLTMDGPGQGVSNLRKIRAVGDNYERAGKAVIDYLQGRPEILSDRIALYGISMGSFWSTRIAAYDERVAALCAGVACFNPNNTIFSQSSPRFKQMFMYMAGMDDEREFDAVVEKMHCRGYGKKVKCPTLLVTGEFDPLAPLEDTLALFAELSPPKELWVFEDEYHPLWKLEGNGGLGIHQPVCDWLSTVLKGDGLPKGHTRKAYIRRNGFGPWGEGTEFTRELLPKHPYF